MKLLNPRSPARWTAAVAAASTAVSLVAAGSPAAAEPNNDDVVLLAETFGGGSTQAGMWKSGGTGGGKPCLTASAADAPDSLPACGGTPDADGSGVLRLTTNEQKQSGYVIAENALSANRGANFEFDMYQYNASRGNSADGMGFFIIDGAADPSKAGEPGAGLGYRGLEGAIVGIGFDDYGNFSNKAFWKGDGPGPQKNHIVVRGAADKYAYITGKQASQPLALGREKDRTKARRHVVVSLSTGNVLSVSVDYGQGLVREIDNLDLDNISDDQPKLPKTFKVGFAASTGGSTAVHEISGLRIRGLKPNLQLKVDGPTGELEPGGTGTFTATVSSTPTSGPTYGPVKLTIPVRGAKVTSVSGEGWECDSSGDPVTCTRPGTGPDELRPGTSYPPVTIETAIPADAKGEVEVGVTAETDKEFNADDNTVTERFKIKEGAVPPGAEGPNVGLTLAADGDPVAGRTGNFKIDVANAADTRPTTGRVVVNYDVPKGSKVTEATGDGWDCQVERWNVECSREDALEPGATYPSIALTSKICAKYRCRELKPTVRVTADGDIDESNNVITEQAVPLTRESALKTMVTEQNGGLTVQVVNEGPSDEPNGLLKLSGIPGLTWKCEAPKGSACPAELNTGSPDGVPLYVAGGATVVLRSSGDVPEGAQLTAEVTPLPTVAPETEADAPDPTITPEPATETAPEPETDPEAA